MADVDALGRYRRLAAAAWERAGRAGASDTAVDPRDKTRHCPQRSGTRVVLPRSVLVLEGTDSVYAAGHQQQQGSCALRRRQGSGLGPKPLSTNPKALTLRLRLSCQRCGCNIGAQAAGHQQRQSSSSEATVRSYAADRGCPGLCPKPRHPLACQCRS